MGIHKRGRFITFEGIDGSGKSTQIDLMRRCFLKMKIPVLVTHEPGGSSIGRAIRKILLSNANSNMAPLCELFLFMASRAQHVQEVIHPNLIRGKVVICDRFTDSSLAYQGVARKLGVPLVHQLNRLATQKVIPDLTFWMDIPVDVALKRINQESKDRFEHLDKIFFKTLASAYRNLMNPRRNQRIVRINANRPIQTIHSEIVEILHQKTKL